MNWHGSCPDFANVLLIFLPNLWQIYDKNAVYYRLVLLFTFILFNHFFKKMLDKKVKKDEYKKNRPPVYGFVGRISPKS